MVSTIHDLTKYSYFTMNQNILTIVKGESAGEHLDQHNEYVYGGTHWSGSIDLQPSSKVPHTCASDESLCAT